MNRVRRGKHVRSAQKKTMGLSQRIEEEKLIDTSEQIEEEPITVITSATATRQKSENKNKVINEKFNPEPHKPDLQNRFELWSCDSN